MLAATPITFLQEGDRILLRLEALGVDRIIYLDPQGDGIDQAPTSSALGHSVGYWDHGVLMVGTKHVSWPYYDSEGTPVSDQAEFIERFTLKEAESRLYYQLTVIDRGTFRGPVVVDKHWEWMPGAQTGSSAPNRVLTGACSA